MIIDFHTHTFPDRIAEKTLETLSAKSHSHYYSDGTAAALSASMKKAGIDLCVNLPVMTNEGQCEKVNDSLIRQRDSLMDLGIISFGGMHPAFAGFAEKLRELKECGVKGIKLHPAYQETDLNDVRMMRIIEKASELDMIVITHAGLDIGLPEHNYADPDMILEVIDRVAPGKFVLAHMGGWSGWDDVEKYLAGAPVWMDTAFSIGLIEEGSDHRKPLRGKNMEEEDFLRLCRKHGTDRILFATDSPWADQSDYVESFKKMSFTQSESRAILGENARKLLEL